MDGTPAGRSLQDRPLQSRDRANPVPQRTHRPHEWNCSRRSNHRGIPATAWSAGDPPLEQNPASLPPPIQQENHSIGGCFHTAWTYSGNYEFYEQQRALSEKQQQAQFERQQAMLAKEINFIERFKARASHAAQVQSRVKKLEKIDRVEPPRRRQTVQFDFLPAPRSGEDVVSLKNVHKGYGNRSIYEGLDFQVRRKERWCVMGVNGAGKSTLLKLVAGSTQPDDGTVALGGSVKMGYFAQHAMELLDGERTVFQSLEDSFP